MTEIQIHENEEFEKQISRYSGCEFDPDECELYKDEKVDAEKCIKSDNFPVKL